ncbi:MAG TPA: plastocyanin/azurin family copper-binding protein [Patescibacteria group bacterium]|nr:plastocyanin/azurin family copper-binding protein [Patescibacteria group bacterium]
MLRGPIVGALSLLLALAVGACGAPATAPVGPGANTNGDVDVAITGSSFVPANVSVRAGAHVRWINREGVTHTVTFDDAVDSGRMSSGSTFTRGFPTAGTFSYHCSIHPTMKGTVTVTP